MTDEILDKIRGLAITIQKNEDGSLFIDNNEGTTLTLTPEEVWEFIDELSCFARDAKRRRETKENPPQPLTEQEAAEVNAILDEVLRGITA